MFKEKNFYVTIKVKIMKKLTFFYIKSQILLRMEFLQSLRQQVFAFQRKS